MKENLLEIACFEISSAEVALRSIADRIEFCAEQNLGGITPKLEEFIYLKSISKKPIFVMIRPKGGGFFYSDFEFEQMKNSLIEFKKNGADGFVFGILTAKNQIDIKKNRELIEQAGEIPCTFHRAIDRTPDLEKALEILIELNFKTVLTSGGKDSAIEGKENLKKIIEKFGTQIDILLGGGVRSNNIEELKRFTNGTFFHSSAIPNYEIFVNEEEIKKLKSKI